MWLGGGSTGDRHTDRKHSTEGTKGRDSEALACVWRRQPPVALERALKFTTALRPRIDRRHQRQPLLAAAAAHVAARSSCSSAIGSSCESADCGATPFAPARPRAPPPFRAPQQRFPAGAAGRWSTASSLCRGSQSRGLLTGACAAIRQPSGLCRSLPSPKSPI